MVAMPNMNWMGNEPTGSAYDVYRYYMGGGNPDANAGGGGGGGTTGIMQAFPTSGGGGGFNPYNTDMSKVNTRYTPNYDYRQFSEYGFNPSTLDRKNMGMNQEYFYGLPPSELQRKMSNVMNVIPGVGGFKIGAEFLGSKLKGILPVNQRAIFENELRGSGVYTDDIGRIVAAPGGYNTPEGIMAGYNAAQMTDKTFDKRTDKISDTLASKYGISQTDIQGLIDGTISDEDIESKYGITTNLTSNITNIALAKKNWQKKKTLADNIAAYEKEKREEEKKKKKKTDDGSGSGPGPGPGGGDTAGKGSGAKAGTTGSWTPGGTYNAPGSSYSRPGASGHPTGHHWAEGGMVDADLSKDPEYLGWKKVYKMNPELGSMHEKHPTFIKFYKKHERDQKKFGGLAGLLYG